MMVAGDIPDAAGPRGARRLGRRFWQAHRCTVALRLMVQRSRWASRMWTALSWVGIRFVRGLSISASRC